MIRRCLLCVALGVLLSPTLADRSSAASSTSQSQSIGYDCSAATPVGYSVMGPLVPQTIRARHVLFLSKSGSDTTFRVGTEYDVGGGYRSVASFPGGLTTKASQASAMTLLRTLETSNGLTIGTPTEVITSYISGKGSVSLVDCDGRSSIDCREARPLHGRVPNDPGSTIARRWVAFRSTPWAHGETINQLGFVYQTAAQAYYLDSFSWIVPIPKRGDVVGGLKATEAAWQIPFTDFPVAVQRGAASFVKLACNDGGNCKPALSKGSIVNATASPDLMIQQVSELDFVQGGRARSMGFIYDVVSGQEYLQAGTSMTPFAGRSLEVVVSSLMPFANVDPLAAYSKNPTGWLLESGPCAGDSE